MRTPRLCDPISTPRTERDCNKDWNAGRRTPSESKVRIVIELDPIGLSPRELRLALAEALRDAITRARMRGALDWPAAEELWRCLPALERA